MKIEIKVLLNCIYIAFKDKRMQNGECIQNLTALVINASLRHQ